MKLAVFLLMAVLGISGCRNVPATSADHGIDQAVWQIAYSTKANNFTARTYECITEMYSLKYRPVNGGPVCRDACRLFAEVNSMVDSAPAYVENPSQYRLSKSEICELKLKKKETK